MFSLWHVAKRKPDVWIGYNVLSALAWARHDTVEAGVFPAPCTVLSTHCFHVEVKEEKVRWCAVNAQRGTKALEEPAPVLIVSVLGVFEHVEHVTCEIRLYFSRHLFFMTETEAEDERLHIRTHTIPVARLPQVHDLTNGRHQ